MTVLCPPTTKRMPLGLRAMTAAAVIALLIATAPEEARGGGRGASGFGGGIAASSPPRPTLRPSKGPETPQPSSTSAPNSPRIAFLGRAARRSHRLALILPSQTKEQNSSGRLSCGDHLLMHRGLAATRGDIQPIGLRTDEHGERG
jgi:hypothetical protein